MVIELTILLSTEFQHFAQRKLFIYCICFRENKKIIYINFDQSINFMELSVD
jgi:hypothetical protein